MVRLLAWWTSEDYRAAAGGRTVPTGGRRFGVARQVFVLPDRTAASPSPATG